MMERGRCPKNSLKMRSRTSKRNLKPASVFSRKRNRPASSADKLQDTTPEIIATPLVKIAFEKFFRSQTTRRINSKSSKTCQQPNCANCKQQKVKPKSERFLPKKVSDKNPESSTKPSQLIGDPVSLSDKTYYEAVKIGNNLYESGDYVLLTGKKLPEIGQIQYIYSSNVPILHVRLFCRASKTFLGKMADPYELFVVDSCDDFFEDQIVGKANVTYLKSGRDFKGPYTSKKPSLKHETRVPYFYSRRYQQNLCRFVEYIETEAIPNFCDSCSRKEVKATYETPVVHGEGSVRWKGVDYQNSNSVLLKSTAYRFKYPISQEIPDMDYNEYVHPEYYRTKLASDELLPFEAPFCVGLIEHLCYQNPQEITVKVRIFFRPENTSGGRFMSAHSPNLVYWSSIVITTDFENIHSKCYLKYFDNDMSAKSWIHGGPNRFYFVFGYNSVLSKIIEVPVGTENIGRDLEEPKWPVMENPYNCLEIYAGNGSFSDGLNKAGLTITRWAIENNPAAREAFQLNHPECAVVECSCIDVLRLLLERRRAHVMGLPEINEVDFLAAAPQSHDFLNRFNQHGPQFYHSQIATSLSFCEFYRPKYFLIQTPCADKKVVREIYKLSVKVLLMFNYQMCAGLLQIGNFGVPSDELRFVLLAAAPGFPLPALPSPRTAFLEQGSYSFNFQLQLKNFEVAITDFNWDNSAPFRALNIEDAISDLAEVGADQDDQSSNENLLLFTNYQEELRNPLVDDCTSQICKELTFIDLTRVALIPQVPEADWRHLPNTCNDTFINLEYKYCTLTQDPEDPPRGVCACAIGEYCDTTKPDYLTIIPWELAHGADKKNHFCGAYGRLNWRGYLRDRVSNATSVMMDGRVIHPVENRVITVREVARCRGFHDDYVFFGSLEEQYKQAYEATPPPFALALGQEFVIGITEN